MSMAYTRVNSVKQLSTTSKWSSYVQLLKLKLTSFVVISAVFGYFIGAQTYNFTDLVCLIVGGFLVTGASNIFNQAIEKNYDALMKRTKDRPLPTDRVHVIEAYWLGLMMGMVGVCVLGVFLGPLSGVLGTLAIFMYVWVYTPMKRITPFSVVVGAFPGAIPPMLGWVAATGSFSVEAGVLFAIQFIWQFPHFWAIAWKVNTDYQKAGFKMLPFGKKDKRTALIILLSSILLSLSSVLPEFFGIIERKSTIALAILSLFIVFPAIRLFQKLEDKYALRMMLMSYLYLIGFLLIIFIDRF